MPIIFNNYNLDTSIALSTGDHPSVIQTIDRPNSDNYVTSVSQDITDFNQVDVEFVDASTKDIDQQPQYLAQNKNFENEISLAEDVEQDASFENVDQINDFQISDNYLANELGSDNKLFNPLNNRAIESYNSLQNNFSNNPIDQVKVYLSKAIKDGENKIILQLNPIELGRLEIQLDLSNEHNVISIIADRLNTLDLLQKDSHQLERILNESGINTDNGSLNFSFNQSQQQQQNPLNYRQVSYFEIPITENDNINSLMPLIYQGIDLEV